MHLSFFILDTNPPCWLENDAEAEQVLVLLNKERNYI
jgi:hypothetical protein